MTTTENNDNKTLVEYIKDKHGLSGCLFAQKESDGYFAVGWSKYNRKAEGNKFNNDKVKKIALSMAKNRADKVESLFVIEHCFHEDKNRMVEVKFAVYPASYEQKMNVFLNRCYDYFKGCACLNLEEDKYSEKRINYIDNTKIQQKICHKAILDIFNQLGQRK